MTEIKIEKKKLVWPWILLGLAIIALLIYFLAFNNSGEEMNDAPMTSERIDAKDNELDGNNETELINVKENNNTITEYIKYVNTHLNKMGLDHKYTNEALLKLIKATNAIADEVGYNVRADLEKAKEYADMITDDRYEITHADNIRKASDMLTKVLHNIQKAKYPGLTNEITELRNASEAIKPGVQTLNQRNEVKAFFAKAADLLEKMN